MKRLFAILAFVFFLTSPAFATVTYIQKASNSADGSDTSVAVTVSSTGAGNLIVAIAAWEGSAAGTVVSVTDGTTAFTTSGTIGSACSDDCQIQYFYLTNSNSGKTTVTCNWTVARTFKRCHVYELSYTGGTIGLEIEKVGSSSADTAVTSGNFVQTIGSDGGVVFGFYKEYSSNAFSAPLYNAVAADQSIINSPAGSNSASWEKVVTAGAPGPAWVCMAAAFKVTAAGGAAPKLLTLTGVGGV